MRLIPALAALALLVPAAVPVCAWADDATILNGRWEGWYSCPTGETGLSLDLTGAASGEVKGTLAFGPMGSENIPKGRYEVAGSLDGGVLSLKGERWIEQPTGGVMIDLTGAIKPKGGETLHGFAGKISTPDCIGFLVGRPLASK